MKFSFFIIFALSLCLILMVVVYYMFSKIQAADPVETGIAQASDSLRTHAVNDFASKLSFISKDPSIPWPTEWQQLGSSVSGCQLYTLHCQIPNDVCLDIGEMSTHGFIFTADSVSESPEKYGYAVKREGGYLEVIACFTNGDRSIKQKIRL